MAVNNYAPAEYGGYVQGADSGGGGGGGSEPVLVNYDYNVTDLLDKTWQQIHDAFVNGVDVKIVYIVNDPNVEERYIRTDVVEVAAYPTDGEYDVACVNGMAFRTDNASGYPMIV